MGKLLNKTLLVRTLSAVVFVAVVAGAVLCSQWTFALLMIVVGAGCLWEFYRLAARAGIQPQRWYGTALGVLLIAGVMLTTMSRPPMEAAGVMLLLLPLMFAVFVAELYRKREQPLLNIAATFGGIVYVALPVVLFYMMSLDRQGMVYLPWQAMSYFFIVWANDTGAYLVGVAFGRHRLMERISPKKSWEGFFGGVVAAVGVGWLTARLMDFDAQQSLVWAGMGLVIAVSGVWGDLVESMFKRSAGVKDSGAIMPGHGGWLDRFDALLLSVPFAFTYYIVLFPVYKIQL